MAIKCRLCGRGPNQCKGVLHRVNEKGVTGIWECRPICGAEMDQDDAILAAVEGWFDDEPAVRAKAEEVLSPCIGKVKPQVYEEMIQYLAAALPRANVFCTLAKPGRGDCEHFVGLPETLDESTTDAYGKPHGWCAYCWLSYRFSQKEKQETKRLTDFEHWLDAQPFHYRAMRDQLEAAWLASWQNVETGEEQ